MDTARNHAHQVRSLSLKALHHAPGVTRLPPPCPRLVNLACHHAHHARALACKLAQPATEVVTLPWKFRKRMSPIPPRVHGFATIWSDHDEMLRRCTQHVAEKSTAFPHRVPAPGVCQLALRTFTGRAGGRQCEANLHGDAHASDQMLSSP